MAPLQEILLSGVTPGLLREETATRGSGSRDPEGALATPLAVVNTRSSGRHIKQWKRWHHERTSTLPAASRLQKFRLFLLIVLLLLLPLDFGRCATAMDIQSPSTAPEARSSPNVPRRLASGRRTRENTTVDRTDEEDAIDDADETNGRRRGAVAIVMPETSADEDAERSTDDRSLLLHTDEGLGRRRGHRIPFLIRRQFLLFLAPLLFGMAIGGAAIPGFLPPWVVYTLLGEGAFILLLLLFIHFFDKDYSREDDFIL